MTLIQFSRRYESTTGLRSSSTGKRASAPPYVTTSSFVTMPIYPLYATSASIPTDKFDAIVFINYPSDETYSWTFEVRCCTYR